MDYRLLGSTEILVSRLCYGTLTMGPLQSNLSPKEGAYLLRYALGKGVNFLDTAEFYENYAHIARAIRGVRDKFVIASKSYAYTYDGMRASIERALAELGTDYIDLFLLHEQESRLTLKGHEDALLFLQDAKKAGKVRAIGVSTHTVEVVDAAVEMQIDVVHPIVNVAGLGIADGTINDMLDAMQQLYESGKGLYGMKPLGGGNLINDIDAAFKFVLDLDSLDSIAVGMQSKDEIDMNTRIFSDKDVPCELRERVGKRVRRLHIDDWCVGCGACVRECQHGALHVENGKCKVDVTRCVLCGYCSRYCSEFCIKVV